MNVSIIAIGDELLIGQVVDTNSGDIARMIAPYGWRVNDVQVVADDSRQILRAIDRAFASSDIVLTTGGLGPTKDDITKSTLTERFGGELRQNPEVLDNVKRVIAARGLKLNELTAAQAIVPTSCTVIQNEVGTAPLMWFDDNGSNGEKVLVAMPGVPFETRHMMQSAVLPRLLRKFPGKEALEHRVIMVDGMSESAIAGMLAQWEEALPPHAHLAYLPKPGVVRLRIDVNHSDRSFATAEADRLHQELAGLIPEGNRLSTVDLTPAEIMLNELTARGMTVATAESCTGGTIAQQLTAIPGASAAVKGGVVAYSNGVKTAILGVDASAIASHGAVSLPVVKQMAEGARRALGTDCAVATSGIAGPGGATPGKPVGTVCIAAATASGTIATEHHFPGDRARVIDRAATTAMLMLIHALRSAD